MLILIILAGISSAAYLCETIDGGNFTQNGQWPDRPGQLKYPHLGGYWNIKAVDHTQIEGDTFKNRTYVDEVEWVAFKYQTGLPARGIILSPVWVIQSEKYWISLEGKVNIKGPADVGRDLWDNLTISVYQKECNASSWSQIVFTSHQDSQKSSNIQVKFLIKSNGGTCQMYVAIAGEKQPYISRTAKDVAQKIYSTFGILFFIMMVISIMITMLICKKSGHKTSQSETADDVTDLDDAEVDRPFTKLETIPE